MLMIMYGIKSKSETDTHFLAAQRAAAAVSRAMIPGAFLVDIFPTREDLCPLPQTVDVQRPS